MSFESIFNKYQQKYSSIKSGFDLLGNIKLAMIVLTLIMIVVFFNNSVAGFVILVLSTLQLFLWIYHSSMRKVLEYNKGILDAAENHLKRIDGKWTAFLDKGEELIDPQHNYSADLDIVGDNSLFQMLNITHTLHGRKQFAGDLLAADYAAETIRQRQEAVKELSKNREKACELEYIFSEIGADKVSESFVEELQDSSPFTTSTALVNIIKYGSAVTGAAIAANWIFGLNQGVAALALIVLHLGILQYNKKVRKKYLSGIKRFGLMFEKYSEAILHITDMPYEGEYLKGIQQELSANETSAKAAMKELSKIADYASVISNPVVYILLNVLFLWDYRSAFRLQKWKEKYSRYCAGWFDAIGRFESLLSLSVLPMISEHSSYPELTDVRCIQAQELGHPLINSQKRVCNDLNLQDRILVISGSNMSGKTTFIRTVGINMVLARAGAPVCAKNMVCSLYNVVTSMRLTDDLSEGVSTFYAELKRIKMLMDTAQEDRSTLFLIDEIFRGTNSVDRLAGAKAVLEKLSVLGVSGMITTHDLELCRLEESYPRINNHSFSEQYADGQISFDYKLQEGRAKTTNAKYLMEMLGIME